jgi:hypothetical protein
MKKMQQFHNLKKLFQVSSIMVTEMLTLILEMEHNRNIQESEQLKLIHNYSCKN